MQDPSDREFILAALDVLLQGTGRDEPVDPNGPPTISVIMPVFNREMHIETALDSLRRQTWRSFEAIVIDDASRDRTSEILAAWSANEPWLRVMTNAVRSGASASRNRGLAVARGKINAYLDSDNWYYPHALETIARTFRSSPDVWSMYGSHLWSDASGALHVRCPQASLAGLMAGGNEAFDLNVFAHRRALYDALGGFDERLTRLADWELIIRYAKVVMPRRVPVPIGHYRDGNWPRISNQASYGWNHHLLSERNAPA